MTDERALARIESRLPMTVDDVMKLGAILVKSGFFKSVTSAEQAVAKILAGRELGLGPVASMTHLYIVEGTVGMKAALVGAKIKQSGRYDYHVDSLDDKACTLTFSESSKAIGTSSFTIEDAHAAGLTAKSVWRQYPRNMLLARALTNGARWYCPDVFSGPIYTVEELGGEITFDPATEQEVVISVPAPVSEPASPEVSAPVLTRIPYQMEPCPIHKGPKTTFFKSGKMKSYAHPIGETGNWCNWHEVRDRALAEALSRVSMLGNAPGDSRALVDFVKLKSELSFTTKPKDEWTIADCKLLLQWANEMIQIMPPEPPLPAVDTPGSVDTPGFRTV